MPWYDQYTKDLAALVHSMRHINLQTLILDRFRLATPALTDLLAPQAQSLECLALLRPEQHDNDFRRGSFPWLGANLALIDFLVFNVYDVDGSPLRSEILGLSPRCR
ncbi:hypothetical protein B0A48_13733 [Cryoendolithus antarcticus]|uniref:Uncharacterized protein n=1 Tax=Cryoendolithus antarcticus TaxID=1507870 RepID=A0A1V8SMI9_9PEZI|nr:hypothetical protein B0A48_13733 [Cryoendolithus antarcticus]